MTTYQEDPQALAPGASPTNPPSAPQSPQVPTAARPKFSLNGAALQSRWDAAWDHAQRWVLEQRDDAALLIPASLYLCVVGALMFDSVGIAIALGITVLLARLGPNISADTMLSLYRAQPIAPRQGAALRSAIALLSERAGLSSQPAIAIIPSMAIGVFSVGRHPRTAILLTEGLLRRFSLREIVAIAAHEIAHIKAGDLPTFSLGDAMTRFAQLLSYAGGILFVIGAAVWLLGETLLNWWPIALLILAPFLNSQLQLSLSRQREYNADRLAATLLGDPTQVVSVALAMEPDFGSPLDDFRLPVPQRRNPIPSPIRAHIAGAERAERLRAAENNPLMQPLTVADEPLVSLVGVGPIEMRPRDRWPGLWF